MNLFDLARTAGILAQDWPLASGNFHAIVDATARYSFPRSVDLALFLAAIGWESLAAALCWRAFARYRADHPRRWPAVYLAHSALIGLFGAFIVADEVFHDYKVEGDHRDIMLLLLMSLVALQLLPDTVNGRS